MSDLIVDNQPGRLVLTQPFTSVRGPADVWQQVGPKWHEFDRWASSLDQISATDFDADSNTVGAGRSCSTAIGDLAETVTAYDEDQRLISYQIIEGRPPVAEAITATWNIGPGENEGTAGTISMAIDFIDDAPDGIADMMTEQMGGLVGMIAEELVHFVETGEPHPRKAESTNG